MKRSLKALFIGSTCLTMLATGAAASGFNIPGGDLATALDTYSKQTGLAVLVSGEALKGVQTRGAKGELTADAALASILSGTGFTTYRSPAGAIGITREEPAQYKQPKVQLAQAKPVHMAEGVETIVVTSSKIKGDIQTVPIAITALSQEQLTSRQIAGGPDLVKEVPNLTFSKTNFTGYNIQIRGIGTQAISVTTDPAVAVSFNDVPFLRNHFFEQEFYDVGQVEVLRGPQGTLYGRNATAGVVNVVSAKPVDHWEAMASVDVGNYKSRRLEGMLNIPLVGDKLDFRVAGEWTKRDGYSFNAETGKPVDGRDLWSTRASLLMHPIENLTGTLVWEHFNENDDRLRSSKQLCAKDEAPSVVDGPTGPQIPNTSTNLGVMWLEQGCKPVSLYSPDAFQTPNASAVPFVSAVQFFSPYMLHGTDPYAGQVQSSDLRQISSLIDPHYRAKNDTYELNVDYLLTPELTLTSQTAYNRDSLNSNEDFNRYNTTTGIYIDPGIKSFVGQDGEFCDPQLGCSSRLVAEDISDETAQQFYQEVRLASAFNTPFNFVVGANYLNYHTRENYYIFSNAITLASEYFNAALGGGSLPDDAAHIPFDAIIANSCNPQPADPGSLGSTFFGLGCSYIDPNPLDRIDGEGHNYFRSQNPYRLSSWAGFGEVYYNVAPDVKLTGGLRLTDDKKIFDVIPSWALIAQKGYLQTGVIRQEWREVTGRANVTWTPKLSWSDQSLIYASYARGYKGGGANPPGVIPVVSAGGVDLSSPSNTTHPVTFKPEFNDAFELGTKNTMLDGAVVIDATAFLYKYENYQISQIIDRTAVNMNVNANVKGFELETSWSPIEGLKFGFNGGYEDAKIDNGQSAIDIMDRTAGHPGWMVVKPFVTETSNCILPTYVVNEALYAGGITLDCAYGYSLGMDPVTWLPYTPTPGSYYLNYSGFDPRAGTPGDPDVGQNVYNGVDYIAPNNGEGFAKDIGGNQLPNAPHFTTSFTADFTVPVSDDWAATVHGDFYWQSQSFARIFNDRPYDKLRGYSNVNFALILTNSDGWQVMGYVKNVFDTTAITGAFLNSDDTALTTNIFTTDPRLLGIRITKSF